MQPQFLVRHFPAPKLQLHANLVSAIEEFFAVTHFCQVIVLVDVHPEFEFFQPSPCWSPVPLVFGNVVSEFSERSSRTFSIKCSPSSWCAISRPRNCNCTRTLFPRSRNSSP